MSHCALPEERKGERGRRGGREEGGRRRETGERGEERESGTEAEDVKRPHEFYNVGLDT